MDGMFEAFEHFQLM